MKTCLQRSNELENKVAELLAANGYKCNADGRAFIAAQIPKLEKRSLDVSKWLPVLEYAEKIGGCLPGEEYIYPNAQGTTSVARVAGLYKLPADMVNPVLVCFSGIMTAHLYAFEAVRWYAKQQNTILPLLCIGKSGNKGLYESVFNRSYGLMIGAEYVAYKNAFSLLGPESWVRANERNCQDIDTAGNFDELYEFAKASGKEETTFVLCSGNFSYDKRLLAEFMLKAADEKYSDVKLSFVLVHCPLCTGFSVVDGHISETMLGYVAASIGPLLKDTITFDGQTTSAHPERYLMPGVAEADWNVFKELICDFSNMGWPNYAELLYGVSHQEAVKGIIFSDLYARASFTAEIYDGGILEDIARYQEFIGQYCGGDFLTYLKNTPDYNYFKE